MRKKTPISAIYRIENTITKRVYVGATDHLVERWMNHRIDLRNGKHKNSFIQEDYNQYGLNSFIFSILEECKIEELEEKELSYITSMKTTYEDGGYNISTGRKISELTKKRISDANSGRIARIPKGRRGATSKYLGVDRKKNGKYCSRIYLDGKQYNIGYFETEVEAALAYNEYAQELLGWKAVLNIIPKEELEGAWL